jgi:plastocyanin
MTRIPIALALVAGALVLAAPAGTATANVSITAAGFIPDPVEIVVGDTVTWTNADTVNRQVVSTAAGFASPILRPGESFSFTFRKAGRFAYEDPVRRPRQRGTVVVEGTVTIAARPRLLTYGGSTTLSGAVSSEQAGEPVNVFAQPCGESSRKLGDTTTTSGGAWSFTTKPLKNTAYRAQWRAASSANVTVRVRPRMRLGRIAPRRFNITVSAAQSFAGKTVLFQRFNATTQRWVNVRSVVLAARDTGVAPTVISGRIFVSRIRGGLRVRTLMPQSQAGACYAAGVSNVIRS